MDGVLLGMRKSHCCIRSCANYFRVIMENMCSRPGESGAGNVIWVWPNSLDVEAMSK